MVEWLDERDTLHDELRQEMRGEFAAVRQEMRAEFVAVRQESRAEFVAVRQEISALREEMRAGFAAMDVKFSERNAELMKWALGFWIASFLGVVGALVALTRVPR